MNTSSSQRIWRWGLALAAVALVVGLSAKHARKAGDREKDRTAIVRWRGQIQDLVAGQDVYRPETQSASRPADLSDGDPDSAYPNPPVLAIALYPLTLLPRTGSALVWFYLKALMAAVALYWSFRLAAGEDKTLPLWAMVLIFFLALRPLQSDLEHGNVNILILFLVTAGLYCFSKRWDGSAGLLIALATAFKVTPALFIVYFAWKRQWRALAGSVVGLLLFLVLLPGLVLGQKRNVELLDSWRRAMIMPYVAHAYVETLQHNQSLPGLVHRFLTDSPAMELKSGREVCVNVASLDRHQAQWVVKGLTLLLVLWMGWLFARPLPGRGDWRWAVEWGMVFIAMLVISERTWKHHYVTMVLPFSAIVAHLALRQPPAGLKRLLIGALVAAMALMAATSKELGGWMMRDLEQLAAGHKYAQIWGCFLLAGLCIFIALSALLVRHRPIRDSADACPTA